MDHLFKKLSDNADSDIYPLHMPGHKRNAWGELPPELYRLDITEIDGFDNLHQPQGILEELQRKASSLYGADESFYLVNGSTCGILSAVSAALPVGGHILMTRSCHMSAYHAAYLRKLKISYLYPDILEEYDIPEAVKPEQVREALEREADIGAVLIVSPTYEGRIADVRRIADIVHKKCLPLIVDEAHGAHLGLSGEVHENSCQAGADIVVHSVHKTLPSLTQTALLHVSGKLVDRDLLRRFLHIYQSSSPSYLLLAGIDNALQYVEKNGDAAFRKFADRYYSMLKRLSGCRLFHFLPPDRERQDIGKLVISTKAAGMSGKQLYDILLEKYHLQLEMAAESFALAMFTIGDKQEGFDRLTEALLEIDRCLTGREKAHFGDGHRTSVMEDEHQDFHVMGVQGTYDDFCPAGSRGKYEFSQAFSLSEAWDAEKEEVLLEDSAGRYAGEFVNLYPPGIPLLVPGERFTEGLQRDILKWIRQGLNVQGIENRGGKLTVRAALCGAEKPTGLRR